MQYTFQADEIRDKYGDVTICVNNAGVVFGNTILESESEEILHAMKVNTAAHFWVSSGWCCHLL